MYAPVLEFIQLHGSASPFLFFSSHNKFNFEFVYIPDLQTEVTTLDDGSYSISFDGKTYSVSAELKQEGERTVIVSVIDGVKSSASVVVMGHSVHLFISVSIFRPDWLILYLLVLSADNLCKQFGIQIRPDKMSGLIWIQTV